jgi:chorismate mutase
MSARFFNPDFQEACIDPSPPAPKRTEAMKNNQNSQETRLDINSLREQIDQLDKQLLEIFNQRAALALEIGAIKKQQGLAIYDPTRERLIFERVKTTNPGPLDNEAMVRLFERVIDESRRLERIHTQGD